MNQTPELDLLASAMPGEWLRQARLKAELTVEQMAKALNLDQHKIEAIEASRFVELGAPVYVKGYLRKYARLVNVPEVSLLQHYDSFGGASPEVVPVPVSHNMIPERRPVIPRWGWALVWVVVLLAIAASLYSLRKGHNEVGSGEGYSQQLDSSVVEVQSSPLQTIATTTSSDTASQGSGQVAMTFTFREDSWVEVIDANKQRVIYENVSAGDARSIRALAPLQVTLGSASAISVDVNAKPGVIPATRIDRNVARFIVNQTGVIE